jgi:hypothetical protein
MRGEPVGGNLLDFWRWSASDVVSNATRGVLAEYIVARALLIPTDGVRDEWDKCDLRTTEGITIQVKSAAFVQSWHQKKLSKITFDVKARRGWNAETNLQDKEAARHSEVYVFALLAHEEKRTVDALDISQWKFYVLPTRELNARQRSQHSIMLKALDALAGGHVAFDGLRAAVDAAARRHREPG